jgi:hypothetical protein
MLKRLCAFALFATLAFGISVAPAFADAHKFTLDNKGGHQIASVYLSPLNANSWGPDLMGSGEIAPGASQTWDIATDCEMDVKVVYDDGTTQIKQDVDTCNADLELDY